MALIALLLMGLPIIFPQWFPHLSANMITYVMVIAFGVTVAFWNAAVGVVNGVRHIIHQPPWRWNPPDPWILLNVYFPLYTIILLVFRAWVGHAGGFAQALQGLRR